MRFRIWAASVAAAVAIACAPALVGNVDVAQAATVGSATVTAQASSVKTANAFDFAPQKLTVKGDAAESYGYTDNGDTGKVTLLDVIVDMQAEKYGARFTKDTAADYLVANGGWLSKVFGVDTSGICTLVNHDAFAVANETYVSSGDAIELFAYQDTTGYGDYRAAFSQTSANAAPGQSISLKLEGIGVYSPSWASRLWKDRTKLTNANGGTLKLATVNADGSHSDLPGATLGDDGIATVTFSKAGTYLVTAYGSVYDSARGSLCPVALPYCTVKVSFSTTVSKVATTWKSAKLTWGKTAGAKSYQVYRSAKKSGGYKKVATVGKTSWTDRGVKTGKTYYYKVRPVSASATGSFDAAKKARIAPAAPAVKAKAAKGKVYRASKKGGTYRAVATLGKKAVKATLKAKAGKTRYYKVKAYKTVKGKKVFTASSAIVKVKAK